MVPVFSNENPYTSCWEFREVLIGQLIYLLEFGTSFILETGLHVTGSLGFFYLCAMLMKEVVPVIFIV